MAEKKRNITIWTIALIVLAVFLVGKVDIGTESIVLLPNEAICVQEDPKSSTVSDGNCGLVYTGDYFYTTNYLYINYTKPLNAKSNSLWELKYGYPSNINNISIPSSCWGADSNKLILRTYSNHDWAVDFSSLVSMSYGQCFNGNSWETITPISQGTMAPDKVSNTAGGGNLLYATDKDWSTHVGYYVLNLKWSASNWCCGYPVTSGVYDSIYEEAMNWVVPASCSDGDQNQDETGIDCGGVCGVSCEQFESYNPVLPGQISVEPGETNTFQITLDNVDRLVGADLNLIVDAGYTDESGVKIISDVFRWTFT